MGKIKAGDQWTDWCMWCEEDTVHTVVKATETGSFKHCKDTLIVRCVNHASHSERKKAA